MDSAEFLQSEQVTVKTGKLDIKRAPYMISIF